MHIRMVQTRSGRPNIEVGGVPYHSPYDPVREAARVYAELPLEGADLVLHFGWGLGYSGAVLGTRLKATARVFVFEPDARVFEVFRAGPDARDVLADARFHFVVGDQIRQFFDAWTLDGCQDTDRFLWIDWPRAAEIAGDVSRTVRAAFESRLRDRAANLLTHFQNGQLYFKNAVANFRYAGDPVVSRLFGRFPGVPLVLVSAGPSLDRNIRDLRGFEQRCFILAVDTALRPLLAAGVVPHAVIVADPSELNARHIAGTMPPDTYLIAEQAVHPSAMAAAARRFQFSVGVFPDSLYREFGQERAWLEVWGSVATAALDLACRMGNDPIIFTGQDFAYTWGRDYASHTIFHGRGFDRKSVGRTEPDIWGRSVPTTENLIAYRDFFLRRMAAAPGRHFINATEGGILGQGVEILSLRDALGRHARRRVDVPSALGRAHAQQPAVPPLAAHLQAVLDGAAPDCGCLASLLDLVAKRALVEDDAPALEAAIAWAAAEAGFKPRCQENGSGNMPLTPPVPGPYRADLPLAP